MIADTSFLISLFLREDVNHHKAIVEFAAQAENSILVPDCVAQETFTVISYKKGIEKALWAIEELESIPNISFYWSDKSDWKETSALAKSLRKDISFVDYFVIYLSKKIREETLCFDKQLLGLLKK